MLSLSSAKLIDPLPPYVQQDNWSCGPCVVMSVLLSRGIYTSVDDGTIDLDWVKQFSGATKEEGTRPAGLIVALEQAGLHTEYKQHTNEEALWHAVAVERRSVILNVNAWGWSHWVALVGRTRGQLLLCDPASNTGYSYMRRKDLAARWPERMSLECWNGDELPPHTIHLVEVEK